MTTRANKRRIKKKRSTTLDPSTDLSKYSLSPSPRHDKKLKSKTRPGMSTSKSANRAKKKGHGKRRRATSNAPLKPGANLLLKFDTKIKPKSKKSKAQTPVDDYIGTSMESNENDPSNVNKKKLSKKNKKKSSMTPKVSLSTNVEESMFSSDDELNGAFDNTYNDKNGNTNSDHNNAAETVLTDSRNISIATKDLTNANNNTKTGIQVSFEELHTALTAQKNKLLTDLENIFDSKKEELISIEQKLFENGKKSKNLKQKQYTFNANVHLVMDKDKILAEIKKYGYISGGGEQEMKQEMKQEMDVESESTAMKQKVILGEIQENTMSKLDIVVLMEKEARKKSLLATKLTAECDTALRIIAERTKVINEKISLATPELDKASQAVSGIDPRDINEIKTLKAPPKVIGNVMTATVMLLGHKITEWRDVQRLLSYKFKPELLNFDTYTLSKQTRKKVYKLYASNPDFTYDRVYEASKVCGNLVLWVLSQINYSRMLDVIIPLEKEVKKLKKQNRKKQKLAKELIKIVKELEDNIKLYTNQCNQMIDHIIKSTDYELKQFSDKLQPLNEKFYQLLNNKVLD